LRNKSNEKMYSEYYRCDVVLGNSYGDEGKGKVVYDLMKKYWYSLCVRFNGSGNAGHTVYDGDKKYVVHQLPVGCLITTNGLHPHFKTYNLISSGCLVDIKKLFKEIDDLKSAGIDIKNRLFISGACHVITQDEIDRDVQNNVVGTTGTGIGPTYSKKMERTGIRIEDEIKKEDVNQMFKKYGISVVNMRTFPKWFYDNHNVGPYTKLKVMLEGAQGFELDIDWTNQYPYCTSSTCSISGAINAGFGFKSIENVYGVAKAYDTYVGSLKFEPDEHKDELTKIGDLGHEYGSTTGRRRQCNYMNLDNLIESIRINECNICIINKFDILEELNIFKLYHNRILVEFDNSQDMCRYIDTVLQRLNPCLRIVYSRNPHTI